MISKFQVNSIIIVLHFKIKKDHASLKYKKYYYHTMAYLRHLISLPLLEKRESIVIVFIIIINYHIKIRRHFFYKSYLTTNTSSQTSYYTNVACTFLDPLTQDD